MERWSEAAWVPATSNAGPFTGGAAKGLLHTTEGHRYTDALAVYQHEGYWPHATLSYETGMFQAWQHLDLDVAAKALEHPPATPATNTDHVIQVEIVGSADPAYAHANGLLYVEDFPIAYLAGIAAWMRYVERVAGVMPVLIAPFGLPGTVHRLSEAEWHGTSGWCGHCHVPNNHHVDPGNIPIRTLFPPGVPKQPAPSTPLPASEDPVMPRSIIDPKAPADDGHGRIPNWAVDTAGNIYCWDGARQLKSLSAIAATHAPIEDVALHPSGDGLVLFGADGHYEPSGEWARSTYTILVGM